MSNVTTKRIEITAERIQVIDQDKRIIERIPILQKDTITLKSEYTINEDDVQDLKHELKGNINKNFIILEQASGRKRFDFLIDSHYMLNQLNKIIQIWQDQSQTVISSE